MARAFCVPGVLFLLAATVLNALVAISLPFLDSLDIVRVHFSGTASSTQGGNAISQIRFGTWAHCEFEIPSGDRSCSPAHNGYSVQVHSAGNSNTVRTVSTAWTRGLAVSAVAAVVSFIALLLSFSQHVTVTLLASLASFLAAAITLIAFAIQIALFANVHHQMGKLQNVKENTNTAPGFWMTFVAFFLLCFAGCTVCFGRRRDRMYGSTSTSYPMKTGFFSRFRR